MSQDTPNKPSPPPYSAPPEPSEADQVTLLLRLLDLVPDFFYVHDEHMRFWYANQTAADYFGCTKEQLEGKRLDEVDSDPVQAQRFIEVCQQVMREGTPRLTDGLQYRRRDGRTGYLRQHDIPFEHPMTGQKMLLGLSRDVTVERELADERVRRAGLERELEVAREIQRSLRPPEPVGTGRVRLAAYSEPAAFAGGDFYDWWTGPDGRTIVCIGHVSGHGVGAALLAAECRAYARVLFQSHPLDRALSRLVETIGPDLYQGKFITFAAAEVCPHGRELRFVSAGHGPTLVVRAGGGVDTLGTHGPPLGVFGAEIESPTTTELARGDTLVLLSDGVIEARGNSGAGGKSPQFGVARLREALGSLAARPPSELVERVVQQVCEFCAGSDPEDDVTLLAVRSDG